MGHIEQSVRSVNSANSGLHGTAEGWSPTISQHKGDGAWQG